MFTPPITGTRHLYQPNEKNILIATREDEKINAISGAVIKLFSRHFFVYLVVDIAEFKDRSTNTDVFQITNYVHDYHHSLIISSDFI